MISRMIACAERTPPPPPRSSISIVTDTTATARCDEGFLRVHRRYLALAHRPEASFPYDCVERQNLDAVAVIPHYVADDMVRVLLRSCVRPPLALRRTPYVDRDGLPAGIVDGDVWEIPAGLVEAPERTPDGLARCGARELHEELGIEVDSRSLVALGGPIASSAGMVGELIYFFSCALSGPARDAARGDGSPLEENAEVLDVPLVTLVEWCDHGSIVDGKTEIAARRLQSVLERAASRGDAR